MSPAEYLASLGPIAPLEADYQNALMVHASMLLPVQLWRQNAGIVEAKRGGWVQLGPEGCADITGFVIGSGVHLEIECKLQRRKHEDAQKNWGRCVVLRGGIYVLARYADRLTFAENVTLATANIQTAIAARNIRR